MDLVYHWEDVYSKIEWQPKHHMWPQSLHVKQWHRPPNSAAWRPQYRRRAGRPQHTRIPSWRSRPDSAGHWPSPWVVRRCPLGKNPSLQHFSLNTLNFFFPPVAEAQSIWLVIFPSYETVVGSPLHWRNGCPEPASQSASDTTVTSASINFEDVVELQRSVLPQPGEGLVTEIIFSHRKLSLFGRRSPRRRLASRPACICSNLLPPPV